MTEVKIVKAQTNKAHDIPGQPFAICPAGGMSVFIAYIPDDGGALPADEVSKEADQTTKSHGEALEEMQYKELQKIAGNYDGVKGNLPKDELVEAIKERL